MEAPAVHAAAAAGLGGGAAPGQGVGRGAPVQRVPHQLLCVVADAHTQGLSSLPFQINTALRVDSCLTSFPQINTAVRAGS